uniref:uncharacterized protein LOC122601922 n=1 Tax=Erigeron canadensis TaxID=72917 RepID=UPI001CB92814|nr:uncharacterized protein LOC122601922 [Erigeron canadensis]
MKKKNRQVGGAAEDGGSNGRRRRRASNKIHGSGGRRIWTVVVCCAAVVMCLGLLVYKHRHSSPPPRGSNNKILNSSWNWNDGRRRRDTITYQQILNEHDKVASSNHHQRREFPNPVLAYVTPWNSKGYEAAKDFHSKLTHISPVWYHLQSQGPDYVLHGKHNVDPQWISDLRSFNPTHPLILPRIVLEAIPMDMLNNNKQRAKVIDLIIAECKEMDFDGIVLESWSRWAAYGVLHDPHMRNMALLFIKKLGQAMHAVFVKEYNLQLVYVIGPPRSDRLQKYDFGPEDLQSLSDFVDGYSLMTYDFSNPQKPGPNAPLEWVHSTMQLLLGTQTDGSKKLAQKIFLGINFYGNDFVLQGGIGGGPILGRDYLSLLEKHKPQLQWEKKSAEHFFLYSDKNQHVKHVVFYPSLLSIAMRLDEARSWGAGISIWEIGQGLDYFFDLLRAASFIVSLYVMSGLCINGEYIEVIVADILDFEPLYIHLDIPYTSQESTLVKTSNVYCAKYYHHPMEALNAAAGGLVVLKPIFCVAKAEPRKQLLKIPKPNQFHGKSSSLVLLSSSSSFCCSVFSSAFARALTYEEALNQSTTTSDSPPDFDVSGVVDSLISFGVENPVVVAAGAALLALPIILSQVFGGSSSSKSWGVQTARVAYDKLGDDVSAQLLDIRPTSEIRAVGGPDIRGLNKKPVTVAYNGDDKQGFLKKLAFKFKQPEDTTLFILDKFDGSSELVAELVTVNGFKAAFAIKDGAEGPRGWMNSGLPWILPKKSLAFDFGSLTDAIDGVFGEGSEAVSIILGIAAATGLSLLAFTEVETILEVLGSAALVQLVSKKLLFAEDRKKTLQEFNDFVTSKIGPKELLDDIKDIGKALLPPVTSKVLPAPATTSKEAVVESTNSDPPEVKIEAATPLVPPAQVNAVPKVDVKEEELPKPTRSLSPYPYYPDLKPPTSPTPSRP